MRKAIALVLRQSRVPTVSYGPFRLMEAVPWLMFASAMRIVAVTGGIITLLALVCSTIAIFLAFLLAARRMIELTDGETGLGRLNFQEQMKLAQKVLGPVVILMLVVCFALGTAGARLPAMIALNGVDGIAFDQHGFAGMGWSAFLAAVMLVMILRAESTGGTTIFDAFRELWLRSMCMVPAIVAVTAAHIALSVVQGMARIGVYQFWHTVGPPQFLRTVVFVVFVFGFASVRLWVTLAILTFALRESYRRGHVSSEKASQQA